MTNQDVIDVLESPNPDDYGELKEAIDFAVVLIKKDMAEKPKYARQGSDDWCMCPLCGDTMDEEIQFKHCPECGKRIDWSDFQGDSNEL
jgi:rubrerythrin